MFDCFEAWMRAVDAAVERQAGLSVDELPDCPYRDWFDDGEAPVKAARRAVRLALDGEDF